ncbi:MAG: hypothetical protein K9L21_05460 [Spirochaetia bacterium]|nr:hypothetical protein [Spirochaetia bacterium]
MKYQAPKGLKAIYHNGKKYPVIKGIVEIPGEPVANLVPIKEQEKSSADKKGKVKE